MSRTANPDYSPSLARATQIPEDGGDDDFEPLSADGAAAGDRAGAPASDGPLTGAVPMDCGGERLDKVLAQIFPAYSRSRLQAWIENGRVTVDGAAARVRQRVAGGEAVRVCPEASPEEQAFTPEPLALAPIYEDSHIAVFDKPAGLVVHPAAGNWSGTLLNGLLHRYPDAAALPRAGIVHRLDKDTSGLMVVARTLAAQTDLVRQLQARTVKRYYAAVVWGTPPARGVIEAPIGRDPRERVRMAVVQGAAGKPARTRYATLASGRCGAMAASLVCCSLDTGRTHQIRVHLAHLGHPLAGDPLYRARLRPPALPLPFARQALHAWQLGLNHPATGEPMRWQSPLPPDLRALLAALDIPLASDTLSSADDLFATR